MAKEMAVKKESALAAAMPSYIEEGSQGAELIDQNDLSIPRLVPVNALSKPFKDGLAKCGDLIESVGQQVLFSEVDRTKPVRGVFIGYRRMRNKWKAGGAGTGIECHSDDGSKARQANGIVKGKSTDDCSVCEHAQFTKMPDGTTKAPACTAYRELLFLAEGYPVPLIVAFSKSSDPRGKKLMEKLNSDMGVSNRPLYAFAYDLSTEHKQKGQNDWYDVKWAAAGFPDEQLYKTAKGLYEKYKGALQKTDFTAVEAHQEAGQSGAPAV